MKSITYKHTLSGGWDNIQVKDKNGADVFYKAASVFFTNDIILRGREGEEEIPIASQLSPMNIEGSGSKDFPYQVKGTGSLLILTMN